MSNIQMQNRSRFQCRKLKNSYAITLTDLKKINTDTIKKGTMVLVSEYRYGGYIEGYTVQAGTIVITYVAGSKLKFI
jgi:hypothetical protein